MKPSFRLRCASYTIICWLLLRGGDSVFGAVERVTLGELSAAEKYLIDQATAGEVANLTEQFTNPVARVIRGRLIEELLTGARKNFSMHRNGLMIEGAVVRELLDLRNAKIAHDTRLAGCTFEGGVNLSKSGFENSLSIEGSVFNGPATLFAMKVGRGLYLSKAIFNGAVDFSQMEVVGVMIAGEASFNAVSPTAEFAGLKVSGNTFFTNTTFAGPVNFQYCQVTESFRLDGMRCTNARALVCFESVRVAGVASLAGAEFKGYVSFKDATVNSLDLSDVKWPSQKSEEWLWLNGLSYQRIAAGAQMNSWSNLFWLVDQAAHRSAYSTDVYASLREFYRREGYPRQANKFFIAQKRREREEVLHGAAWGWSLFLDWFVGYGRSPERALFWSAAIVLFGMKVFRPNSMEPRRLEVRPDPYSPFWYSMDLFLPLVKLHDADVWKPRDDSRFARFWSRFHTMLGWALIPIAVAAWTGMLET
jgi:hypothetical protein